MNYNDFSFVLKTKVIFRENALEELKNVVTGKNVFIMTTAPVYNGIEERVNEILKDHNVAVYRDTTAEPTTDCIAEGLEIARSIKADTVIGLGGGSAMDASKIISCLVDTNESIFDYVGRGEDLRRNVQLVLVPTTAGTGSEATKVGVFTNSNTGFKFNFRVEPFFADYAIVDPVLTYTCPKGVTGNSGIDALTHATESYWCANANPMTDAINKEAIKLVFANLKNAYDNPTDPEARKNMALAAMMTGTVFSQTSLTIGHACAYDWAFISHLPHGTCCSILMPTLARMSVDKQAEKMQALCDFLGMKDVEEFANAYENLMKSVNIPTRLSDIGVKKEDLRRIAEKNMQNPNVMLAPINDISTDKLVEIFEKTF